MRILLQRVSRAEARVVGADRSEVPVGRIGRGFVILVGFTPGDGDGQIEWMADKVAGLRVFGDDEGRMNLALADVGGAVLVVSQFTLYGDASKGRRPSFVEAARSEVALGLYERFISQLRGRGVAVESGEFGADMRVELINEGPVTLWLER